MSLDDGDSDNTKKITGANFDDNPDIKDAPWLHLFSASTDGTKRGVLLERLLKTVAPRLAEIQHDDRNELEYVTSLVSKETSAHSIAAALTYAVHTHVYRHPDGIVEADVRRHEATRALIGLLMDSAKDYHELTSGKDAASFDHAADGLSAARLAADISAHNSAKSSSPSISKKRQRGIAATADATTTAPDAHGDDDITSRTAKRARWLDDSDGVGEH